MFESAYEGSLILGPHYVLLIFQTPNPGHGFYLWIMCRPSSGLYNGSMSHVLTSYMLMGAQKSSFDHSSPIS